MLSVKWWPFCLVLNVLKRILLSDGRPDGFVEDCSDSIANTLELLQSCTKPMK